MLNVRRYLFLAALAGVPCTAVALPPLLSVQELIEPLVDARAADIVRKGCPAYSVNMVAAYREARALEARALRMGYSKDEVRAFIKDKAAKKDVKDRANALLTSLGAQGDTASLCAAGDLLVSRSSLASKLIRR